MDPLRHAALALAWVAWPAWPAACPAAWPAAWLAAWLAAGSFLGPCPAQERKVLKQVDRGKHLYGAKVGPDDLEGRVVLFVYWGMSPGCRDLLPALLEASRDLADRPIHIILTGVEDRPRQKTMAWFAEAGLSAKCPNITVTKDGEHPKVKYEGYVPYYLVFDHRGRLVHHHMGGKYHGGDGRRMVGWLEELSRDVPDFYFGTEPFLKIAPLAERVEQRKKLPSAIRRAEELLDPPEGQPEPDAATKAELQRLLAVIRRYRDRKLKSIELIFPSQPGRVIPMLTALRREFRGTRMGAPVEAEFEKQKASARLERAVQVHEDYEKSLRRLHGIRSCKYCRKEGRKHLRPGCFDCHTRQRKALVAREVAKLRRLYEAAEGAGLTIAKEIEKTINLYTSPIVEIDRRR